MKDKSAYILTNKDRTNPYQLVAYDYVVSEDGMIQKKRVSLGYFSNQIKANKERVAANKKYPSPLTFKFMFDAYLKYKTNISKQLRRDHKYAFKKLESIHDKEMNKITVDELKEVVSKTDTFSARKKVRLILSQLYKYGIEQGVLEDDLSAKFKLTELDKNTDTYDNPFSDFELDLISSDNYDDKTYDIAMFIMKSGIKTYTVFSIKNEDIDFDNNQINIKTEKRITKKIKYSNEVMDIARKYSSSDNEYLFTNHLGKQLEYSVFRRYSWNPFMKHYKLEHSPQDCYATYLKYGGEKMATRKRANGYGGIAYRKGRANPYMVEVTVITPEGAKRKVIGSYKTEREAQKMLDNYNAETLKLDKSKYAMTFADVYEKWIEYRKFVGKAKNPDKDYLASYKALSTLHNVLFTELTTNQMNIAIKESGRNAPTLKKMIQMLKQMYKYAIAEKIVEHDQSAPITIGAHSDLNRNPNSIHHEAFTAEEIKELFSDTNNKEMVDVFKFMIYTGVRTHEFLTLTKDSINLENKTIHIKKEFSKTYYSERYIPIHPDIYELVKEKYGHCVNDEDALFKTENGLPFKTWNFRNTYWKPFMELHGLSSHYPHDTRYTFSTFWDYCHLDTRDGEVILGHTSKSDITKLYKTPNMVHRYNQMKKLTFDIQSEEDIQDLCEREVDILKPVAKKINYDSGVTKDDFLIAKQEMKRLGFTSFTEYNEYLEFVNSRRKKPPEM